MEAEHFLILQFVQEEHAYNPSKVKVYGYIMLPDTAEKFAGSDAKKSFLYRNGFTCAERIGNESLSMESGREEVLILPMDLLG